MAKVMRYYVVLRANTRLREIYFNNENPQQADLDVMRYVAQAVYPDQQGFEPFRVVARPSADVQPGRREKRREIQLDELTVALRILDEEVLNDVAHAVETNSEVFVNGGADVLIAPAEHWCPREALEPIFGDRPAAERLVGADYLRDQQGLNGRNVNVVLIDQGVSEDRIRYELGGSYGGGWDVGTMKHGKTASPHGMMMARNILKIASEATIFDLPLLPERIGDVPTFLDLAQAAYQSMLDEIAYYKQIGQFPGPWVLVNAWAVFDRRTDLAPPNDYCNRPKHPFNRLVRRAVRDDNDVVFCAGNCGQFCPDTRCGPSDRGPGCSILGANSHPDVLTVGAVRADAMWLGYSSQGPGQPKLARNKPDLCASSQFGEPNDASLVNTGTSAAAGMAAGVITALRGRWGPARVPPGELIRKLKATARKNGAAHSKQRFGSGILDARAAFHALP